MCQNQAEEKYGKLISFDQVCELLKLTRAQIEYRINKSEIDRSMFLVSGEDVIPTNPRLKMLFKKNIIDNLAEKEQQLSSLDKAQEKYGEIMRLMSFCKKIKIYHEIITNLINNGFLKGLYLEVGKDISSNDLGNAKWMFPLANENKIVQEINHIQNKYYGLRKDRSLISDDYLAKAAKIKQSDLIFEVNTGAWDKEIYDVAFTANKGRYMYFFSKEKLKSRKLQTITMIAASLGIHSSTLYRYINEGDLIQPDELKGTRWWDIYEIKKEIYQIQDKYHQRLGGGKKELYAFDYLGHDLQILIEAYLEYRKEVRRFRSLDGFHYSIILPKRIDFYKNEISIVFFKMICGRCGINIQKMRDLNDVEIKKYDPRVLLPLQVEQRDIVFMKKGWDERTIERRGSYLRPFVSWVLKQKKLNTDDYDNDQNRDYRMTEKKIEYLLEFMPYTTEHELVNKKVYLTRKQIIIAYNKILKNPLSHKNFENAVLWMFSCFTGVRPEEILEVKISHFDLDHAKQFLKVDKDGYGVLRLPAAVTKGGYSWSHLEYGTLIVPELVEKLNKYLRKLYKYQEAGSDGYIFRPKLNTPNKNYSKCPEWIKRVRETFDFLPKESRKFVEIKTGRRSMNQIIRKQTLLDDVLLDNSRIRAAEIQMRHDMKKKGQRMNDAYTVFAA